MMQQLCAVCGLLLLYAAVLTRADGGKKVFCYYSSFAQNRQGIGKFLPEDIDPFLCTHIVFAFVDISHDGTDLVAFNRNDAGPNGLYERTQALKKQNPVLKVLLAVGGWQIGSKPFIPMVSDHRTMKTWINNVIVYLRKFNFDGFDMDWEFPATRGSPPEDKYRYTNLMKGLYEAFAEEARETGREKLLLTMATASGTYFISTSYEPQKIVPYMDYMLLMTYNYHGQWEKRTGHHSPLWKHRDDPPGEQSELFQNWSIDFWLDMGVPKDKLVIGLATYGMSFTLVDSSQNGVHSPAQGGGRMGQYTKETGIMAYYEICQNIQNKGWKTSWIEDQGAPYAYGGDQWVGFDNVRSIKMKVDNILKRDLAGAFVWSVEMDDFDGVCGDGRYPILSTITQALEPYKGMALKAPTVEVLGKASHASQPKAATRDSVSSSDSQTERTEMSSSSVPPASPVPVAPSSRKQSERKPALSNGNRVTWWGKPTGRPKNGEDTRLPWWRQITASFRQPANSNTHTTPKLHNTPSWNALPTGHDRRTITSTPVQGGVNEESVNPSGNGGINRVAAGRPASRRHATNKQESSAESQSGESISCHGLGSGLHLHPEDCEKFIMCMPGAWLQLPPHIMSCPAGTRFDERIKVCNHAASVMC